MAATAQQELKGREAAITGRLASMSRREAIYALSHVGGQYVESPRSSTDILVVGGDGPPLGPDGHPTKSLLRARDLRAQGVELEIIDEEEFVLRLGLEGRDEDLNRLYTTAQLSRILKVPPAQIRSWVRNGLIEPTKVVKRLCYFEFSQVACARRLHQLTRWGITPGRIRRSLEKIDECIPTDIGSTGPALLQLESMERGSPLLVRLGDGRLAEPNGQLRLDFDSRQELPTGAVPQMQPREDTAEAWFHRGVIAEESGLLDGAVEAYQRALALGDPQPEICFNLGNSLYALGRCLEAASCFIQATEIDADYVEAWNNLGNSLAETGKHAQAILAYKRALSIEPSYADAHYNLGESLACTDDLLGAHRHWLAYLRQDPHSEWALRVRERMSKLRLDGSGRI